MADPLSITCSVISICDLAEKVVKFFKAASDAEEEWQRYRNGLNVVACTQKVLENTLQAFPHICELPINENGREVSFLVYVNDNLSLVRGHASTLMERYYQARDETSNIKKRLQQLLSVIRATTSFILSKEQILSLIQGVDRAQQHLHSALMLASIHRSESWREVAGDLLKTIHADMKEHGDILKRLENFELREAKLKLNIEATTTQGKQPFFNKTMFKSKHHRAGGSRPSLKRCSTFQDSKVGNGEATNPESLESSAPCDLDDGHDGDNDSTDNDEPTGPTTTLAAAQGPPATNSSGGPKYDIIIENNEWFQVSTDSEEYHLAMSHSMDHNVYNGHPRETTTAIRATDAINPMSDEEWEDTLYQYQPIEESMEFLTSANCTAYPTDAETPIEKSPFEVCFQRQTHIFISERVRLSPYKDIMSTKLDFCVDLANIADDTQVFNVIEPCSTQNSLQCKHMNLIVGNVPDAAILSPCILQLTQLDFHDSPRDALYDVSSRQSCTLMSSPVCHHPRRCHHTKVEDQNHNGPRCCSTPSKLYGWLADNQRTKENFDIDTETAPSVDEITDVLETDPCMTPSPDDDQYAFDLLSHVMAEETSKLPSEVEWDVFVRFLSLADKYGRNYGDRPLEQAKRWVSIFRPSESLDREAITWLWIMWKLQMKPEFKKLSSIVQRQAQVPISSLKIQCENRYHVELPKFILDILDQRRSEALSTVRDMMLSEIEKFKQQYSEAVTKERDFPPWSLIRTMRSSFAFGYLKLESNRWLTPHDPNCDSVEFTGVSFASISTAVRSMIDLNDWKVATVPPSDRIPGPLAMLSVFVPILGVGLHNSGLHGLCNSDISGRLLELITLMEKQDWGVDLAELESYHGDIWLNI